MKDDTLPAFAEDAFDSIDAAFFSGDTFHDSDAIECAEYYMARWAREIARIRAAMGSDSVEVIK